MEAKNKKMGSEAHPPRPQYVLVDSLYPKRYGVFEWRISLGKISEGRFDKLYRLKNISFVVGGRFLFVSG